MDIIKKCREIIDACLWLQKNNFVVGTWGNLSVRLDANHILLTPSKINYEDLVPEDMVIVDMDGNHVKGYNCATSEMDVHRLIYRARGDVNAIVHCHPQYGCAMCATGEGIPPILEEMTQMIGGEIPCTSKYVRAGEHIALAEETVSALGDKNAVLIRNHAPVCCGRDLREALVCCQLAEKAAKCYLAIKGKFDVKIIPDELVKAERYRFLYKYGHEHEVVKTKNPEHSMDTGEFFISGAPFNVP